MKQKRLKRLTEAALGTLPCVQLCDATPRERLRVLCQVLESPLHATGLLSNAAVIQMLLLPLLERSRPRRRTRKGGRSTKPVARLVTSSAQALLSCCLLLSLPLACFRAVSWCLLLSLCVSRLLAGPGMEKGVTTCRRSAARVL